MALYSDAPAVLLDPMRKTTRSLVLLGPMERLALTRFQNPLPLAQRALVAGAPPLLRVARTPPRRPPGPRGGNSGPGPGTSGAEALAATRHGRDARRPPGRRRPRRARGL